ncbi:class I SAM-dependent methyltransferase [Cohnella sp. CBP 2801]|uniref:Class I SAM-dependent methyltransferase n=1 Tax=Cohnella zeiphila TaxID=2761120 RepID=A0A7X0VWB0_9BACL|nr:class I SAM-dependent methyltransferase [Cohnella zeiphila]
MGYGDAVYAFCDKRADEIKEIDNIIVYTYEQLGECGFPYYIAIRDNNLFQDVKEQLLNDGKTLIDDLAIFVGADNQESSKVNSGYCPICEKETYFYEKGDWLRDEYLCLYCHSIPRERALVHVLNQFENNWRNLIIHESSPGGASADYLKNNCKSYTDSQFFRNINLGEYYNGVRCENLESLTFDSDSIDIFITQDVFEHVMNPIEAFKEIERVLKIGGVHIFTVPIYTKLDKTVQRAKIVNNELEHILEPIYHGNPIDQNGSLVTYDYGLDITKFFSNAISTTIYLEKNRQLGLDGEFLHVLICRKN